MGLSDLIAGGMDATAATELLLNVVWTIVGATLVYFMQAGFAMCEAGFTRAKNTGNILMKNRVIGQNVLMANPSHQTFYPHYVSRSKQLHHPRLKDSFPIDSSHSFADK